MAEASYHHVCLLVPDIHAAVAWFSDTLGITFREPRKVPTSGRIDPGLFGDEEPHDSESYLTYSIEGPPYYELAQATEGNGLHSLARHGLGLQHVGVFVDDVDAVMAELAAKGIGTEARMLAPDGTTLVCWSERSPETGLMVEFMSERLRAPMEGWIERNELPQVASSSAAAG